MRLCRSLLLMVFAVAMLTAPARATAGDGAERTDQLEHPRMQWACVATHRLPGVERTAYLPGRAVDWLVRFTASYRGPCAEYGESAPSGDGKVQAYSQVAGQRPVSVGLLLSDDSLDGLPYDPPNEGKWCYDKNGDGNIDRMTECAGGYEKQLELGRKFQNRVDSPFTYVLNNWNPHGHVPEGVFDLPHFDVHFYMEEDAKRTAIRPGPCPQLVNCEDYELGKRLPADRYLAPDFEDLDAVEPAMGNHLIDTTAPEFHGERFTHTWIYGVWDRKVTFYEAMVTHEWLDGLRAGTIEDGCQEIKLPRAWQESGWYPTTYCMRHRENRDEVTVSMEDFVYRQAG